MDTYNFDKQNFINNLVMFFMNNISKCDLTPYFNISLSHNISKDYKKYDSDIILKDDSDCDGITILPSKKNKKIQILISEESCLSSVILHELTHMYDFVSFSKQFCDDMLYRVKKHKHYQTLIYWSEFHVKQIDIPYVHLIVDKYLNVPDDRLMDNFKKQIKTFYYEEYTKKLLNKENVAIRDIMWYLGEIYVCNQYDENNTYLIPQNVINIYGNKIVELYNLLTKTPNFEYFQKYVEDLYNYFLINF